MDEEAREETMKPPVMNGHAIPVKEDLPPRSSDPVSCMNAMEDEEFGDDIGDTSLQDVNNEEDDIAGPLIPPPQGFRSPAQGRPLSQSVPQVSG